VQLVLQLLWLGLVNSAINALLAIGFGLVYRNARVFHIAYGSVFVVGAYGMFVSVGLGLSIPSAFFASLILAVVVGCSIDLLV
jgi:branched-chain amino acid transport system permease protein